MRVFLADLVLLVHAAYIAFVVGGFVAIVVGIIRKWAWIRNPWFRWLQLAAMGVVVIEAWCGAVCPLTVWEDALRGTASGAPIGFVVRGLQRVLFFEAPAWVFIAAYTVFALLVVGTWIIAPPRRRARRADGRR
jgi:polyferredoxin